jgi:ParB family transcriptional regulator, chromosome partitioning protein
LENEIVAQLQQLSPDKIKPNPDNPRIFFREAEMIQLMNSIREVGIKVPISTYREGGGYVLLDGERRWRSAKRLNLKLIPAIVQSKPAPLENLLMMFNIHNVREEWDLVATAKKIGQIREMLRADNKKHDERTIASLTGVTLTTVKRSFEILDLPAKYQKMLLREAEKPKAEQRIKPDLFLEIYKSLHTVERYTPEVFKEVGKSEFVDAMVEKYSDKVIDNVIAFRDLSKIARAERAGVAREDAIPTIVKLVRTKSYDVDTAYHDTVEAAYEQRDLIAKIDGLTERLGKVKGKPTAEIQNSLKRLNDVVGRLVK